jgi:hypothetical protein
MDTNTGLQQILADLSATQVSLRASSRAFDTAIGGLHAVNDGLAAASAGMRDAIDAIAAANHAQGEAIDAAIAATGKALQLFTASERH